MDIDVESRLSSINADSAGHRTKPTFSDGPPAHYSPLVNPGAAKSDQAVVDIGVDDLTPMVPRAYVFCSGYLAFIYLFFALGDIAAHMSGDFGWWLVHFHFVCKTDRWTACCLLI